MAGIFGLLERDSRAVEPAQLESMQSAMAFWGPDGSKIWHEGPLGLGSLRLHNTPESLSEQLPRRSRDGRLLLTAEARLDNREELFSSLQIPSGERQAIVDSELILRAYERWGQDCPSRLVGDWSFAIWNASNKKLFLAVDHLGCTGLYYYADHRFFAFASSIKALLALENVPRRLNELRLAQLLTLWPDTEPRSIYEDVLPLQAGHSLTVTPEKIQLHCYWQPERIPELRLKSREEYVEGFLDVYTQAVHSRLRSHRPVAAMLSGGLDSGSIAAIAARRLGQDGERLSAFSSVPLYDVSETTSPNRFGDERPYVEALAHRWKNIDVQWIDAATTSPMIGFARSVEMFHSPIPTATNSFWITDLMGRAQSQGIGTMLMGQGGNISVSWSGASGPSMRHLLAQRQWGHLMRKALASVMPQNLKSFLVSFFPHPQMDLSYSAINPEFSNRMEMVRRHTEALRAVPRSAKGLRYALLSQHRMGGGEVLALLGAAYNMEVRDPTYDPRVVAYCLSVPDWVYTGPQGESRWLMRQATIDLLPDKVRSNRKIGHQAADLAQRLKNSAGEVDEALSRIKQSDLATRYLNLEGMLQNWEIVQQDVTPQTTMHAVALGHGIQAGLFLIGEESA
jgi:asparagine synthase (glutamine-hydrolysing)